MENLGNFFLVLCGHPVRLSAMSVVVYGLDVTVVKLSAVEVKRTVSSRSADIRRTPTACIYRAIFTM